MRVRLRLVRFGLRKDNTIEQTERIKFTTAARADEKKKTINNGGDIPVIDWLSVLFFNHEDLSSHVTRI